MALPACGASAPKPEPTVAPTNPLVVHRLRSGEEIEVVRTGMVVDMLSVDYNTRVGLSHIPALEGEVEAIWEEFLRAEAEEAGAGIVYVSPGQPVTLQIGSSPYATRSSVLYEYRREVDGTWSKGHGFRTPAELEWLRSAECGGSRRTTACS